MYPALGTAIKAMRMNEEILCNENGKWRRRYDRSLSGEECKIIISAITGNKQQ